MNLEPHIINVAAARAIDAARAGHGTNGMTQQELADAAEMSLVTVNKLLSGKQSIKVPQFLALAAALEVPAGELIADVEKRAQRLSDPRSNVTLLRPSTAEEADNYRGSQAANEFDPEADQPDE